MELYTLNINVNKQRLSFGENKPEIFSGDQSIDFVEFTFEDAMWNFPDIWAIFSRQKGTSYQVALDDNKVMIPAEVMQKKGYVYIGLMATDGENVQTSNVLQYSIGQGSTNVDAITPSASIYEQFLADLDAYQTAVADLDDIESRITTAEGSVSTIEQAVTDLNEQLDDINADISTINGQITTIQNNIGTAQSDIVSIQNGINTLNGQVAGLDTAVGTLSNRVTALQSSVTSLEGRLTTVGNTLTDFEGRLTTAGTTLTNLEGSISDAENDIQTVQGDIETIQSDIEDIQTAIEQNNVVTDVTAEGISLVDNHIADLSFMCVTDTASGDVASFPDGSGLAMKKAEVSLEPIQDLHGYDKPWAGGSGYNQWDEEWEVGTINASTGADVSISTRIRSKNYIRILPNTAYCFKLANNGTQETFRVCYYDENKTYISGTAYFPNESSSFTSPVVFTTPANAHFMRFSPPTAYGTTYNNDIAINYPSTVTTYSPYENICPIDGYEDVGLYSDSKYGGLIEWNQLVTFANSSGTISNCPYTLNNGKVTLSGTANASNNLVLMGNPELSVIANHVYYLSNSGQTMPISAGGTSTLQVYGTNTIITISENSTRNATIGKATVSEQVQLRNMVQSGNTYNLSYYPQLIDLTQMFGATKADEIYAMEQAEAGAGVAYFKSLFPKDYYAYNAGEVMTVGQVNGDETVEVHTDLVTNIWDEEWEVGGYDTSGQKAVGTLRIRSKNHFKCIPNTTYYLNIANYSSWTVVCFYDATDTFLSYLTPNANNTFTTPNNAHYMAFCTSDAYGNTYNNDISINYPPMPDGKVYSGTVDLASGRLVVDRAFVDLGTFTWTKASYSISGEGNVDLFIINLVNNKQGVDNYICSHYPCTGDNRNTMSNKDKCFAPLNSTTTYLGFRDSAYSTATADQFKSAMSGAQLVYELATPQVYQLTPQQIQTLIGTNNVWSEDGAIEVEYIANLKDYIDKKINA